MQRLRPPLGRALPPAAAYGTLYARDHAAAVMAAFEATRLLAADLADARHQHRLRAGARCAGARRPRHHRRPRLRHATSEQVVALGGRWPKASWRAACAGHEAHSRAWPRDGRQPSRAAGRRPNARRARRPRTSRRSGRSVDMPAAMTAHVVFTRHRRRCAGEHLGVVTREIIRGEIGFDGLLMSDDLGMKALSGTHARRAPSRAGRGLRRGAALQRRLVRMRSAAPACPELAGRASATLRARPLYTKATRAVRCRRGRGAARRGLACSRGLNQCNLGTI